MASIPDIVSITDLRQDAVKVLDRVRSSMRPLIISQDGHAAAAISSMERYDSQERERAMLRRIARGEQEIADGKGHGLRAVMKDADRILERI